jgi:undecaprenyl phosphate N,N'-diacetylbacillosamine 1-phosphate transferase
MKRSSATGGQVRYVQAIIKRVLDLAISGIMLFGLSIPLAGIALAIKLDDGGPIFFRQTRVGTAGRKFAVLKFRTMVVNAESMGLKLRVAANDSRITRVGRLLRILGLDELPQLVNVWRGEMSLVGPRPTVPFQVERYTERQRRRLEMRPGITGLAILRGRKTLTWPERIEIDLEYIERWSILLDLAILLKTPWVVLVTRRGVYIPPDRAPDPEWLYDPDSKGDQDDLT